MALFAANYPLTISAEWTTANGQKRTFVGKDDTDDFAIAPEPIAVAKQAGSSIRRCVEVERRVLGAGGEFGALSRHVALDVGEDSLELGFVAD